MTEGNGRYPPRLTREQLRALLDRRCTTEGAWRGMSQTEPEPTELERMKAARDGWSDDARELAAERDALREEVAELREQVKEPHDATWAYDSGWRDAANRYAGRDEAGDYMTAPRLYQKAHADGAAAEREACARVMNEHRERFLRLDDRLRCDDLAAAIRARGEPK